ncbi:3',5'-cyclic adenosine monophosphate phosphodiesterase CpdA [Pseudonocardia ailaonensis]|uniref:3',5'-cyclic adenosine monophosphate phosphodiesterase CpdA n=1 Tax=Pseudonocardia ailaonensis TaxID=367279 RepID=A0ABN2N8D0_9PSEU
MTSLAVLSDLHLTGDPASAAALREALAVVGAGARPDALLLPGDLTAEGAPAAYALLTSLLDELEIPVVPVMGNHDELGAFTAAFGAPDRVVRVGGARVVALDSTIRGHHHGQVDPEQREWLAAELATPAPEGTVLVLHHPPLPSPVPSVDLLRLREPGTLGEVLAGTDVRMVVCGHAHYAGAGALAGIPVWVAPALYYRVDAFPPAGRLRGLSGPAISRIDLIDGSAVATASPLGGDTVYDVDAAERVAWMKERIPA